MNCWSESCDCSKSDQLGNYLSNTEGSNLDLTLRGYRRYLHLKNIYEAELKAVKY